MSPTRSSTGKSRRVRNQSYIVFSKAVAASPSLDNGDKINEGEKENAQPLDHSGDEVYNYFITPLDERLRLEEELEALEQATEHRTECTTLDDPYLTEFESFGPIEEVVGHYRPLVDQGPDPVIDTRVSTLKEEEPFNHGSYMNAGPSDLQPFRNKRRFEEEEEDCSWNRAAKRVCNLKGIGMTVHLSETAQESIGYAPQAFHLPIGPEFLFEAETLETDDLNESPEEIPDDSDESPEEISLHQCKDTPEAEDSDESQEETDASLPGPSDAISGSSNSLRPFNWKEPSVDTFSDIDVNAYIGIGPDGLPQAKCLLNILGFECDTYVTRMDWQEHLATHATALGFPGVDTATKIFCFLPTLKDGAKPCGSKCNKGGYPRHLITNTHWPIDETFVCDKCNAGFQRPDQMKNHINHKPACNGATFRREASLWGSGTKKNPQWKEGYAGNATTN